MDFIGDLLTIYWLVLWTGISSYGLFILILNESLPRFLVNIYVYGKALDLGREKSPSPTKALFWKLFLVPKRYFLHFYIVAILLCVASQLLLVIFYSRFYSPDLLTTWAPRLTSTRANELNSVSGLIFALVLITIQVTRRAYECLFVSVYSDSKINLFHYMFGFMFYFGVCLSIICPILLSESNKHIVWLDILASLLNFKRAVGFILFVYASMIQYKCHVILANLRRDRSGRVISTQYYVPSGYLFQWVTCPHFFAEVVIYIIISLIVANTEWFLIAVLVASNQIVSALIQQGWYKSAYSEYPIDRKAIIPFLL